MFCKACGSRLLEGARFCASCGSAVDAPAVDPGDQPTVVRPAADQPTVIQSTQIRPRTDGERVQAPIPPPPPPVFSPPPPPPAPPASPPQAPTAYPSYAPPTAGGYGASPPPRRSRLGLWLGIAAAIVILAGAGVAVWQLAFDKNGTHPTTTQVAKGTTTTVRPTTTTSTSPATTSTSTPASSSSTLPLPTGQPGDSLGEWVEMNIPDLPGAADTLAMSDQALLLDVEVGSGNALYGYMFDTKQFVELPIDASDFFAEDVEGKTAVWWEGDYDAGTGGYSNEHIYSYQLPDGPKVEIAGGGRSVYYPQIAGSWVTWVEDEPSADNSAEYSLRHVFGVRIDAKGVPQGDAVELVSEATGYDQGDVGWSYSLSSTHLAWENAVAIGSFDPGVYVMGLDSRQPRIVEPDVWRPALGGKTLVYTGSGLVTTSVDGGAVTTLDPLGDFATAASTFAAYFRSVDSAGSTTYQIVARGFTGAYEQVLGEQTQAPWLSPFIAASDHHVGFITDGFARIFQWQGLPTY